MRVEPSVPGDQSSRRGEGAGQRRTDEDARGEEPGVGRSATIYAAQQQARAALCLRQVACETRRGRESAGWRPASDKGWTVDALPRRRWGCDERVALGTDGLPPRPSSPDPLHAPSPAGARPATRRVAPCPMRISRCNRLLPPSSPRPSPRTP